MSDTGAPAHPEVLRALSDVNIDTMSSYGADPVCAEARALVCELLGKDAEVFFVASGTAANGLALSLITSPLGAVACHRDAHIERDERGAVEFFTGGARLQLLDGAAGKLSTDALSAHLERQDRLFVHETPCDAVSLTNLTECGTAYRPSELRSLADIARQFGCRTHLDGARLANAIVGTASSAAEMIVQSGVDVAVLGLTKTGAMGCEIIILRAGMQQRIGELHARAKRAGHLPPKQRYLAAQAIALLRDDLWLKLADNANQRAQDIAKIFDAAGVKLRHPVHGNEVFADIPAAWERELAARGVSGYRWTDGSMRFVAHWSTGTGDVDALRRAVSTLAPVKM